MPHEDGPFFCPIIANITIGSHTMLDLYGKPTDKEPVRKRIGKLLLEPNSLLIMRDDAYEWLHGIEERTEDEVDETVLNLASSACRGASMGQVIQRGTRLSVTVRVAAKAIRVPSFLLSRK